MTKDKSGIITPWKQLPKTRLVWANKSMCATQLHIYRKTGGGGVWNLDAETQ